MRSFVEEEERESLHTDTEITLGMKSLLGVFFGAVLICGVFFGFGYSLGRGSSRPDTDIQKETANPAMAVKDSGASGLTTTVSDENPAPSDASATPAPAPGATASNSTDTQYEYVATPNGPARRPVDAAPKSKASPEVASLTPAPVYTKPSAAVTSPAPPSVLSPAPAAPRAEDASLTTSRSTATIPSSSAATTGSIMVQIAAVTHQEDATILVGALRKHGYAVVVRSEPKDSLLHVQVGPFATRDEAKAMRTRLLADGYNAILK